MFYSLQILTVSGSYEPVLRAYHTLKAAKSAARRLARMEGTAQVAVYKGRPGEYRVHTEAGR